MLTLHLETEQNGELRQRIEVREHTWFADGSASVGGRDSAPDPHDLFDSALAACKAITVMMYAKQRQMPLERVSIDLIRDNSDERAGTYRLQANLHLIGTQLTEEDRQKLLSIADRCPIHKLMTKTTIEVSTQLVAAS
jgi:putative redox protein